VKYGRHKENRATTIPASVDRSSRKKKHYQRPVLTAHGDVRDVTFGSPGGVGESGNPTSFRS
jgi:hypothetical protein